MRAFLTRHSVAAYFALTFAISWGGVLVIMAASGPMSTSRVQDNPLFPLALVAMVLGPSVTSIVLTALLDGMSGLRVLGSRLWKWRVETRWYALALLTAPVLSIAVSAILSRFSPAFRAGVWTAEDKTALVFLGIVVGITAGVFEELGWTGFAIPRVRRNRGVLATGLILGLSWSAWHFLVIGWGIGDSAGAVPLPLFLVLDGVATLPAFRVLMVWVYERTESLFVAILMHVSLTATTLILTPQTTGVFLLEYGLAFAGAIWLVTAILRIGTAQSIRADPLERTRPLPGDDFIREPLATLTHAITLNRPPRDVWPWLIQMGAGTRAGWYSYDAVDNGRQPSAARLIPEFQNIRVGIVFPALPGETEGFVVLAVDQGRSLILGWPSPGVEPLVTWAFVLQQGTDETTRLIVRARGAASYRFHGLPSWLSKPVVRFVHFVMERKQLTELARRVESMPSATAVSHDADKPRMTTLVRSM